MDSLARLSRRQLLRMGASTLLAAGIWPGRLLAADAAAPPLRFFQLNDLHLTDEKCMPFLEKVIAGLNATDKVDLCLICGDLTDNGTTWQTSAMRDLLKTLRVPAHMCIGNHDHQKQNNDDRQPFEQAFPGRINYTFEHQGWQFIGMDSCDGAKSSVAVRPSTIEWLAQTAARLDRKRPTVLFTHFPLSAKAPLHATNSDAALAPLKELNLVAVFSGHHHGMTENKLGDTTLTTCCCCSLRAASQDPQKRKGYFLCDAAERQIKREFVQVEMPAAG